MAPQCALIADIVGSRALSDRPSAQRALEAVLARAAQGLGLLQEPVATIGDEFQLATRTLAGALVYTARVHLLVPDGLSLRFGIGEGQILVLDALGADGPCVIEWGEQFSDDIGEERLDVFVTRLDDEADPGEEPPRRVTLVARCPRAERIIDALGSRLDA